MSIAGYFFHFVEETDIPRAHACQNNQNDMCTQQ